MAEKKIQVSKTLICRIEGEDELMGGSLFLHLNQIFWHLQVKRKNQKKEDKYQILYNGKKEPLFDRIGELAFSGSGQQMAYTANAGGEMKNGRFSGGKWFIVLNGEKGNEYDMTRGLSFDAEGRLAFWGNQGGIDNSYEFYGGDWFLYYDGGRSEAFEDAELLGPVFDPGGRIAYGGRKNRKYYWLINHAEHGGFDEVGSLLFSSEAGHYAYGAKDNGKAFVVADGQKGPIYDEVAEIAFSPDGKWLVYRAQKEGKWFLSLNHKERFALPGMGKIIFSPAGGHFAFEGKDASGSFVAVNGKKGPVYERVQLEGFSEDGRKFFYRAQKAGKKIWVVNHQEVFSGDDTGGLFLNPQNGSFALTGKTGSTWGLFLNGTQKIQGEALDRVIFSSGGEMAAVEKQGLQERLWIGKHKGPTFDCIGKAVCHPERNFWIYTAEDRGKWYFVANHEVLEREQDYQQILGLEYCVQEKCFIGFAVKNKWVYMAKI